MTPEQEREILRLRAQGAGYTRISKATEIPRSTIRAFLNKECKKLAPSNQNNENDCNLAPTMPPNAPLNWDKEIDRAGQAVLSLFDRALAGGQQKEAMQWIDRFFKAAQAKMGAIQIYAPQDNRSVNITVINDHLEQFTEAILRVIPEEYHKKIKEILRRMAE